MTRPAHLDRIRQLLDELRAEAVALEARPDTTAVGTRIRDRIVSLTEAVQEQEVAAWQRRR